MVSYTTIVLPNGQTRTVEVPEPRIITPLKPSVKGDVKLGDTKNINLIIKCMRDTIVKDEAEIIDSHDKIASLESEIKDIKEKINELLNEGIKK